VITLSSQASAFQSSSDSRTVAQSMVSSHGFSRDEFPSRFGRPSSVSPGVRRPSLISTRLQYRDGDDETLTTSRSWWKNIFQASKQEPGNQQQDNVDDYLEFLDRRYRRIHSNERKTKSAAPFSALNWLRQGSPSRGDVATSSSQQQQQQDALYVLGVAGLASERLLQKHHLVSQQKDLAQRKAIHESKVMDVEAEVIAKDGASAMLIKKLMVPLIRIVYIAHRRKDLFVAAQLTKARGVCGSAIRKTGKYLANGSVATAKTLFEFGGGRKSLTLTFMAVTSFFLVFRPILQAAIAEATVSP